MKQLEIGTLYILSGPQGSGKSTFMKNLNIPESWIVSSDDYRTKFFGSSKIITNDTISNEPNNFGDREVFEIMEKVIKVRSINRLTTFIDAMNLTDVERGAWVRMAENLGIPAKVIIFDIPLETLLAQNNSRNNIVDNNIVTACYNKFQKTSNFDYITYDGKESIKMNLNTFELPHNNIDIIGDSHGLLDNVLNMLKHNNYSYDTNKGILSHPENRKCLFLGDFVDRGEQSIELLQFVKNAVEKCGHYAVMGNHEFKLLRNWQNALISKFEIRSFAGADTLNKLLRLKNDEQKNMMNFIKKLPAYYTHQNILMCHGNIQHFDKMTTPMSQLIFGSRENNSDEKYIQLYNEKLNNYKVIHGHVLANHIDNDVIYSLEEDQAYAGNLCLLPLDKFMLDNSNREAFNKHIFREKCTFNYNESFKKFDLYKDLINAVNHKIVNKKTNEQGLSIYKYDKSVFFNRKWDDPDFKHIISKARGIVLDIAGNIVVHPFDKVFNYGEYDSGIDLPDSKEVYKVEKLNGFLACISLNPYTKNNAKSLLYTTTGSFESDYVNYIKELVKKSGNEKLLYSFFSKNEDITLHFETLHRDDIPKHVIPYAKEEEGLYLIGARRNNINSKQFTEEELDLIAKEINFKRPKWEITTLGEVRKQVSDFNNEIEGYMVRDTSSSQETLFKWKTSYYLTIKFLSRLSKRNINRMYHETDNLKKELDEEFYVIVDFIIDNYKKDYIMSLEENDKKVLVKDIFNKLMKNKTTFKM